MSDLKSEQPETATDSPVADVAPKGERPKSEPGPTGAEAEAPLANGSGKHASAEAGDGDAKADAKADAASDAPEISAKATKQDTPSKDGDSKKSKSGESSKKKREDGDDEGPPLLPKGNPLRWLRGGVTAGIGAIVAMLLMSHNGQLAFGVPLGFLFVLVTAWGIADLLGTFDDGDERVTATMTLASLAAPIGRVVAGVLLFGGTLFGGQTGWGSQWMWGGLVTASFLFWTVSVFDLGVALGPWAKDELGLARPLLKRHGFWVVTAAALLYFPAMGIFSLWDPWETHYGEVAREILTRDDWISLWWAQDGWFWSKPILNFWIQSIAMATLRTGVQPDQMLMGAGGMPVGHPEWVVRAPNVLMTIVAMYVLYKGVAKVFGRRAGMLGALVLATMPDWWFLAHQTMTDMPFVAAMTAAMGLLLLGLHTNEDARTNVYRLKVGSKTFGLTAWHLAFGAILICAIPQILYLLSRNLELVLHGPGDKGLRPHFDEFRSGSAGNCGSPGNENCLLTQPASVPKSVGAHPDGLGPSMLRLFGGFEPVLQGIVWSIVLGVILYMNWGERRLRRLYYIAAWFAAAIATMGKGPAGVALPMICAFAYVCTKKRWAELARLEILSGLLIVLAVALPWYVAMYVRHGSPFTDRLIFHDMFNRAFHHVHDTNEGDDTSFRFYIWQLGYAFFPWTGLVPLGLTYWLRRSDSAEHGKGDVAVFLFMWFLFAFALFSFMGTKFHHYIFPAVPPAAMLVGIALDHMLGEEPLTSEGSLGSYLVGIFAGLALSVAGVARCFPGSLSGAKDAHSDPGEPSYVFGGILIALGVAAIVGFTMFFRLRKKADDPKLKETPFRGVTTEVSAAEPPPPSVDGAIERPLEARAFHERLMLSAASLAGALVLLLVGRDLVIKPDNADQPGAIRLLQLFTYNYRRAWPETLDFAGIILAFTIVAVLLSLALSVRAIRKHAVLMFSAFGFVWALWGLDIYMVKTAPHWGQREVIQAYYQSRSGPQEPLVAYQMNWKGENFYTSNHIPAFVSTGATFTTWMKAQREKGVKVMFFITEHSRIGGLKSEVGAKAYYEVTDKKLNNKFVVVRAEL